MKNINLALSILFLILKTSMFSQTISSPTILPQNPTTNTPVSISVQVNMPNLGSQLYLIANTDTTQKIINVIGCYDVGMLTNPLSVISTLTIGLLPIGNYTVNVKAYLSYTPSFCSKTDSMMSSAIFIVSSSTIISSCNAPDSIVNKYKDDADKLAYRRVYHIHSTYRDSISLNKSISDNYLKALIAVYNATLLPAVDTIVNLYNIHTYNPIVDRIGIKADSNLVWMKNIRNNITPTGNSTIDSLMSKYYLTKSSYNTYSFNPNAYLLLKTDSNCNISALGKKIKPIPGVFSADSSFYAGDNNDIIDSITPNYTWLIYSYGWGDCPNGCFYKRYWEFRVYNDCSVEYMGSHGVPLNVGVKENKSKTASLKIYPNPSSDVLNIEFLDTEQSSKLQIINSLGQTVKEEELNIENGKAKINVRQLTPGIYTARFTGRNNYSLKFIKE